MSDKFDPNKLVISMDRYGNISVVYDNVSFPRLRDHQGSRQFFNINNEFFVKACYGEYGSQCKTEVFQYGKIETCDIKYFIELLGCSDFKESLHWTVWRFVNLKFFKIHNNNEIFYKHCQNIVDKLCIKYRITDVRDYLNGNWWIHNNRPLIVDLGCI